MMQEVDTDKRPIVFPDESIFVQDLNHRGIWHPSGIFDSIGMDIPSRLWLGGDWTAWLSQPAYQMYIISERGIRQKIISESGIIKLLDRMIVFKQYRWQQDNAPVHCRSSEYSAFAAKMSLTDCPAQSPDLSRIEQLSAYLKTKMIGIGFAISDALFNFCAGEWSKIPAEVMEKF
jgi:hypothetical protein